MVEMGGARNTHFAPLEAPSWRSARRGEYYSELYIYMFTKLRCVIQIQTLHSIQLHTSTNIIVKLVAAGGITQTTCAVTCAIIWYNCCVWHRLTPIWRLNECKCDQVIISRPLNCALFYARENTEHRELYYAAPRTIRAHKGLII